ncbi:hypothetical protein ACL2XP_04055 [Sodalis sp. RH21]|uniref:hypothetical protein n=1 Tax=unclassified Sodalis (in: enterobacteria) TaxID=2636512 RepID=UPI0039B3EE67
MKTIGEGRLRFIRQFECNDNVLASAVHLMLDNKLLTQARLSREYDLSFFQSAVLFNELVNINNFFKTNYFAISYLSNNQVNEAIALWVNQQRSVEGIAFRLDAQIHDKLIELAPIFYSKRQELIFTDGYGSYSQFNKDTEIDLIVNGVLSKILAPYQKMILEQDAIKKFILQQVNRLRDVADIASDGFDIRALVRNAGWHVNYITPERVIIAENRGCRAAITRINRNLPGNTLMRSKIDHGCDISVYIDNAMSLQDDFYVNSSSEVFTAKEFSNVNVQEQRIAL